MRAPHLILRTQKPCAVTSAASRPSAPGQLHRAPLVYPTHGVPFGSSCLVAASCQHQARSPRPASLCHVLPFCHGQCREGRSLEAFAGCGFQALLNDYGTRVGQAAESLRTKPRQLPTHRKHGLNFQTQSSNGYARFESGMMLGPVSTRGSKITAACHRAGPNHSLKRSDNGTPPGPGRWYAVHFHRPGPGGLPLSPA
jgi:hypothetical protein